MNAIVSVTDDWAIGCDGGLIVPNREDMRRFVRLTKGGTVIVGRKTFESFPGGPLKGRRNIVITRDGDYEATHPGIECATSPEAALELVAETDPDTVWLIGGERIYRALLGSCDCCYVTKNHVQVAADAFFPDLDADGAWKLEEVEGTGETEAGVAYEFCRYRHV